jgi:hypothetical protein
MRQTLREALGIGHWALPACAMTSAFMPLCLAKRHCHITPFPAPND